MRDLRDIIEEGFYGNIGHDEFIKDTRLCEFIMKNLSRPGRARDYSTSWAHRYEIMDILKEMSRKYPFKAAGNKMSVTFIPVNNNEWEVHFSDKDNDDIWGGREGDAGVVARLGDWYIENSFDKKKTVTVLSDVKENFYDNAGLHWRCFKTQNDKYKIVDYHTGKGRGIGEKFISTRGLFDRLFNIENDEYFRDLTTGNVQCYRILDYTVSSSTCNNINNKLYDYYRGKQQGIPYVTSERGILFIHINTFKDICDEYDTFTQQYSKCIEDIVKSIKQDKLCINEGFYKNVNATNVMAWWDKWCNAHVSPHTKGKAEERMYTVGYLNERDNRRTACIVRTNRNDFIGIYFHAKPGIGLNFSTDCIATITIDRDEFVNILSLDPYDTEIAICKEDRGKTVKLIFREYVEDLYKQTKKQEIIYAYTKKDDKIRYEGTKKYTDPDEDYD